MIHRGTQIPPFDSMGFPRASHRWLFIGDELCARRGERRGVVIEFPMQLCIPGKFGVHARLLEQVQRDYGVWDKSEPEMKWAPHGVIHRGTQIPPFDSMGCPRTSQCWLFMHDDLCARRGKRRGIVVDLPMQLCISGKFGVHAILSELF